MLLAFSCFGRDIFHVSHLAVRDGTLTATFPNWAEPIVKPVRGHINYSLLVPAGEYVEGFRELVRHNRHGQAAFLGRYPVRADGRCTTDRYPAEMASRCALLALAGLMLALVRRSAFGRLVDHVVFPAVYLAWQSLPLQHRRPPRVTTLSICIVVCGGGVGLGRTDTLRTKTRRDRGFGIARRS